MRAVLVATAAVAACAPSAAAFTPSASLAAVGNSVCMSPGAAGRGARPLLGLRMAAAADSARATGLAFALDSGTRKSHSVAENTAFVTGFFRGISNRDTFVKLVTSLWFVYAAMEAAFDAADDPAVKAMDYPELRRRASLEQDLTYFFGGDGWQKEVQPSPATRAYVKHIESVAKGDAQWLLVAHMYTRYLGDLFGGQMMGGMAQKSLNLEGGQGIDFYTFPEIDDNKAFIEQWCLITRGPAITHMRHASR